MPKPKVIVSVSGGVAEIVRCPRGVAVEIRDYDNAEVGPCPECDDKPGRRSRCTACGTDDAGNTYHLS
jgi:hypothetical protein